MTYPLIKDSLRDESNGLLKSTLEIKNGLQFYLNILLVSTLLVLKYKMYLEFSILLTPRKIMSLGSLNINLTLLLGWFMSVR